MLKKDKEKVFQTIKQLMIEDQSVWDDWEDGYVGATEFQQSLAAVYWERLEKSLMSAIDIALSEAKVDNNKKLLAARRENKELKEQLKKYKEIDKLFKIEGKQ